MDVDALNMEEESGDKKFLNRIMNVIKENYKTPISRWAISAKRQVWAKACWTKSYKVLLGSPPDNSYATTAWTLPAN